MLPPSGPETKSQSPGFAPLRRTGPRPVGVPSTVSEITRGPSQLFVSPPANGSSFIVMLRAEPSMNGQATVVGQVTDGLEVLGKISRLPSTEQGSRPYFRPLKDVKIQKVTITPKDTQPAPTS